MQFIKQFIRDEEGQDIIEYGLVLGLIALAGAGALALMSDNVTVIMDAAGAALADAAAAV
jgi:pilus assembly protein Flp/PilA